MRWHQAALLSAAGLSLASTPALAQGAQCADRETVVAHLATKFGETRHGMGIAANNTIMEVYASDATGTWTITVTLPTGITCLVTSGQGFDGTTVAPGDPA